MNPTTFDAAFYLETNADVRAAVAAGTIPDALTHFLQFGQFELRDPNAQFDTSYYLNENPDVLRAVSSGALPSAFAHFQAFGQFEGVARAPSPVFEEFNEQTYLAANPDVAAAVANGSFANGFQHFLQFGFGEERPGAGLDPVSQLAGRLGELDTANANVDVALEAAARLVLASDEDSDLTPAQQQEFIDSFGTSQLTAAIGEAQTNAGTAQGNATAAANALAQARIVNSDAQLNADLAEARADVNADAASRALLQARDNAEAALARDVAADGSNEEVLVGVRDAIGSFLGAGGNGAAVLGRGTPVVAETTVSELLAAINTALGTEDAEAREAAIDAIFADLDGNGSLALGATPAPGGTAASQTALVAEVNVAEQRADLIAAVETAETNLETAAQPDTPAGNAIEAFLTAEGAVEAREALIEANTDAQAELSDAVALLNGLRGFQAVVDDRDELAADISEQFDVNIDVVDGTDDVGTDADDVFVFDSAVTGAQTITDFESGDVLFVGTGFTPVELTGSITGPQGNVNALEIFVQQQGGDTVLFIENQAFEGSTTGGFGGSQITLAGVDADDLILDANGFIRFSEADAAMV